MLCDDLEGSDRVRGGRLQRDGMHMYVCCYIYECVCVCVCVCCVGVCMCCVCVYICMCVCVAGQKPTRYCKTIFYQLKKKIKKKTKQNSPAFGKATFERWCLTAHLRSWLTPRSNARHAGEGVLRFLQPPATKGSLV